MAINYNRLPVLAEVLASGSISTAARNLGLTQSAVSQQIARLEEELGVRLFERSGRQVSPTEAGLRIARAAEYLHGVEGYLDRTLKSLLEEEHDRLDMFCFRSSSLVVLPQALRLFSERAPGVNLAVRELSSVPDVVRLWQTRGFDLGLVHEQTYFALEPTIGVDRIVLANEPMSILVNRDHSLAKRDSVTLSELHSEYWVVEQAESIGGISLTRACEIVGFAPRVRCQTSALEVLMSLAAAGGGIALVPSLLGPARPPGSVLVPLVEPQIVRSLVMLRPTGELSAAAITMRDALIEVTEANLKRRVRQ